jgi:uncharacterized repeat protein (TIGR01451 family)
MSRQSSVTATVVRIAIALASICAVVAAPAPDAAADSSAVATFVDITPDNVGPILVAQPGIGVDPCLDPCASQHNGGRVNGLEIVPGIPFLVPTVYFAASETGGLFKRVNDGSWVHLDGHIPNMTWDVAARPGAQRVIATSFYDGRVQPLTGIQVSADGGTTWTRPPQDAPPGCAQALRDQPSAFGIALRPGTTEVLVGTNCGLAWSGNNGDSWIRFDPTPDAEAPDSVWDAVALPGGRSYACGDDGLMFSPNGLPGTWHAAPPKPTSTNFGALGGYCSVAVSPDDPRVVFVVFGSPSHADITAAGNPEFFEGRVDDSDPDHPTVTWTAQFPYPDDHDGKMDRKSRVPFVVTNDRSANAFDLWVADGSLWRIRCLAGRTPSCDTDKSLWKGSFTDHLGGSQMAHGDSGDLVFEQGIAGDACPALYSSDGGIYANALTGSVEPEYNPPCQTPDFRGANEGLHAFDLHGMAGFGQPKEGPEDLYMATQDNGLFFTGDAGDAHPVWAHRTGGDAFDVVADGTTVVAQSWGGAGGIQVGDRGYLDMQLKIPTYADDTKLGLPAQPFWDSEVISQPTPGHSLYLLATPPFTLNAGDAPTPAGVRKITDFDAAPLGEALGTWTSPLWPCHIQAAMAISGPLPYVLAGWCWYGTVGRYPEGVTGDELWSYAGGTWGQRTIPARTPGGKPAFSLVAVDPIDAYHVYASVVGDGAARMVWSRNGGVTWHDDEALSKLMNDGFKSSVADPGDGVMVMPQPNLIKFDPEDPDIIVVAGRQSGVFLTSDGGRSWSLLTDPHTPGTSGIPDLPQAEFAHFDHDKPGFVRVYLGTGRGIWRVEIPIADLRITKTDSADPAYAGESLTYTVTVANDGPAAATGVVVRDRLPEGVTYSGGPSFCSEAPARTLVCKIGGLAVGSQTSFSITVGVASNVVYTNGGPTTITNTASVSADEIDSYAADSIVSEQTLVKAKADAAIVSFAPTAPPKDVVVGKPVGLTFHDVVTNQGPSSPVDVVVTTTATAPPGSLVTPASSTTTATAVTTGELRPLDETFSITCGVPGSQTFSFVNSIHLAKTADTDPNLANNAASASVTVNCVLPVAINIQPGGFPNAVNLNGNVAVAALTTKAGEYGLPLAFDATRIEAASVRFGPAELVFAGSGGARLLRGTGHREDSYELDEKTRDGDLDLALQFRVADSGLTAASTVACLGGNYVDAGGTIQRFFGCDSIKVSP